MLPISATAKEAALNGVWGAQDAVLTVGPQSSRIEWGHAEAIIDGPIKIDANGAFKALGHYQAYAPGPDRIDAARPKSDAQFEGRVVGDSIKMTMRITGERATRHYVFKKGLRTKLHRML